MLKQYKSLEPSVLEYVYKLSVQKYFRFQKYLLPAKYMKVKNIKGEVKFSCPTRLRIRELLISGQSSGA